MPGRKRHVTEIDGPSYLLEQVLHGEEGQDFTRSTLTDGTEVIGVGDGICFERSATGATTVQFARKPKAKRQGKYHAIDVLTPAAKPNVGYSVCGVYSFYLTGDNSRVDCKHCLKRLATRQK
jgi:hypothetical protein